MTGLTKDTKFTTWIRLSAFAAVLVTLIISACGGGNDQPSQVSNDSQVRPLSDILAGEISFDNPQPNSVTLLLNTSIPVVCAAAYGTTDDYGQLATDTDMMGTGHSNHHPLLTDLQPDTEYHIRLQGIGADGVLYRSDDLTFRTPPQPAASEQESRGENLASREMGARVVGVSSIFDISGMGEDLDVWGADNAIDGNPRTAWATQGDGDDAWIEIELGQKTHVTQIGFWSRTMGASAEIFSIQVTNAEGETAGPFELDGASGIHYFDVDLNASTLRFEAFDTSGSNTGAVEIEVYGEPLVPNQ